MPPDLSALRGTETILVVEDDETVRRFTVHMLTTLGYRVIAAVDGRHALVLCEEHDDHIDLVLTDMIMPHMTGKQFVEQLRRLGKTFKVLFVSGYSAEDTVDGQALGEGIAFFAKPYTRNQLAAKIREVLGKPA
jgi:two-component system, cell cycle sensor histidine kinase and response regulator CckA